MEKQQQPKSDQKQQKKVAVVVPRVVRKANGGKFDNECGPRPTENATFRQNVNERLDKLEHNASSIKERLSKIEDRMTNVENKLNILMTTVMQLQALLLQQKR
ncbi:hypothetical protein niasHT_034954 [Heterodera trifolii]|uniref:Uncharacterized protein n=1 Tax=Heterodera trifolii TaxID=157864 RepID=A0ABD2IC78_9BILA